MMHGLIYMKVYMWLCEVTQDCNTGLHVDARIRLHRVTAGYT